LIIEQGQLSLRSTVGQISAYQGFWCVVDNSLSIKGQEYTSSQMESMHFRCLTTD